jgi:prepilin-type N-terminal cleavage/methylation domain-containing protein
MRTADSDSLKRLKTRQGFTIVELLIVVVVIAILAAITIVSYNGISKSAKNSAIQSSLEQASKKIEMYKIGDPSGLYPASLSAAGLSLVSSGDTLYVYSVSSDNKLYCLGSSQGGRTYYVSSTTGSPKPGVCNTTTGVPGTGDVATDGANTAAAPSYSIFNGAAPGTIQSVGTDGGGSLKIGNRFYTNEPTGIKVTGLRIYNPSSADSTFLSLGITAYAYTNNWTGSTINSAATFAQSPLATKTYSGTRTAGTWTDILFDSPITLPAITPASGPGDLLTLVVQFAGGNHYAYVQGVNQFDPIPSTARAGSYLAEPAYVGRGVISLSSSDVDTYYGIDMIYTPVTP